MPDEKDISRRRFLQYTGLVTGAAAALGLSTVSMAAEQGGNAHSGHAAATANPLNRARMFFTNELDFSTLSEAAERIFPKDEFGPGAKELAVPYFIDNQLAGAYGYNAREYIAGPHFKGAPTQGYQTPLVRRDLFKQGILALNSAAQERFKKDFPQLSGAEQDPYRLRGGEAPHAGLHLRLFLLVVEKRRSGGCVCRPAVQRQQQHGWLAHEGVPRGSDGLHVPHDQRNV